jgi:hypothetical protein
MGGIALIAGKENVQWTGGLPKADWSGLDATANTDPVTNAQYRSSLLLFVATKAEIYHKTGLCLASLCQHGHGLDHLRP